MITTEPISWKVCGATLSDDPIPHPVEITIERCKQRDGSFLFAIRRGQTFCFNKKGQWDFENSPKTKAFLKRCRYASVEEAVSHIQKCENP